jgi:tricorn protease
MPVEVDRGKYFEITNYSWSPDSKWIAYDKQVVTKFSVVHFYSMADKKSTAVTSELANSLGPV